MPKEMFGNANKDFQNGGNASCPRFVIGTTQYSGKGNDWHRSNIVVQYECEWLVRDEEQALARVDREGQERNIVTYHFLVQNSLCETVTASRHDKRRIVMSATRAHEQGDGKGGDIEKDEEDPDIEPEGSKGGEA